MSYEYKNERPRLFTEAGQLMLLKIRDNAHRLMKEAGAFKMSHAWEGVTGDTWQMTACVDRLKELGEIIEVERSCFGQNRVFIQPDYPSR